MDKKQGERLYCTRNNATLKRWRRDALIDVPSLTLAQQGQTVPREQAFSQNAGNKKTIS